MQIVGEQIKLARLRRNLSMAQVAERASCSPLTIGRIEKGAPTVAIGIYLRVLYALQLDDDILLLAKEDAMGKALQDLSLKKREIDFVIENNGNNDNITVEGRITYVPVYIVMFLNKGDAAPIEYRIVLAVY